MNMSGNSAFKEVARQLVLSVQRKYAVRFRRLPNPIAPRAPRGSLGRGGQWREREPELKLCLIRGELEPTSSGNSIL